MPVPSRAAIDRRELLAIFAGGCAGGLLRAALSDAFAPEPGAWPWPTFAVNVAGALLLGYFITRLQERLPPAMYRRPLLGTGFCGALTTFATLQLELLGMLDAGRLGLAAAYVAASLAAGLAGVHLASSLTRRQRVRS